ncbi:MAG: hypothetical protein E7233_01520 [Lachnospiraceae bacterium]|nr:hypothetical protein [Lachnospiraceae bacterium]
MKSKVTKAFLLLAFIFGLAALAFSLFIYLGPREMFLRMFNTPDAAISVGAVIDWTTLIFEVIMLICYLIAFIVFVKSKTVSPAFVAALILLIVIMTIRLLSPVISILTTRMVAMKGAAYMAAFSSLSSVRNLICGPFSLLALVFYCIAFGSLCVRKNK